MTLAARVEGIGLVGPGLENWDAAREILAGRSPFVLRATVLPVPESLPATERRRAGKCVRASLAAGMQAAAAANRSPRDMATIFASSSGDGDNLHAICEALASDDRLISPTRFHNSVHNAPQGYWGIATGSMHAADSIAAFDASFAAGLMEALGRLAAQPDVPVVLISYDAPYPEPLHALRPTLDVFGVAMVLSRDGAGSGPRLEIAMSERAPDRMPDEGLEQVRIGIPAARSLPLLSLLARGQAGEAALEYLDGGSLRVTVAA